MSGPLSSQAVHDRTRAALVEWLHAHDRTYDQSAAILGIGHASAYRRSQEGADWSLRDLVRVICHDERVEDDHGILDQFIRDIRGAMPAGSPALASAAASRLLASLGTEIAALAQRLADGRITEAEAEATIAELPLLRRRLDDMEASCRCILDGHP